MASEFPILEFDPSREALIEPSRVVARADVPEHCVLCFFGDVVAAIGESERARRAGQLRWEHGSHPLYELEMDGRRVLFYQPGVGAPLVVGLAEEVIAKGCRKLIACGGAGVLDGSLAVGRPIVPTAAVRDEGTSYHYLPPGRLVEPSPEAVAAIEAVLRERGIDFVSGTTWTTDAPYRETPGKIERRRAEGCLTVEMEAASLFALARFRGVTLGQVLYAGDDVSGSEWDRRGWQDRRPVREQLFWIAVEACLRL